MSDVFSHYLSIKHFLSEWTVHIAGKEDAVLVILTPYHRALGLVPLAVTHTAHLSSSFHMRMIEVYLEVAAWASLWEPLKSAMG